MYADKYVSNITDLPDYKHWAIIKQSSHSDDYGGISKHITYEAYYDEQKWQKTIASLEESKTEYKAMEVCPASIKKTIHVDIEVKNEPTPAEGRKRT